LDPAVLNRRVLDHVEAPQWGIFGEARVNVLMLNLELDRAQ
jgi:K+-transporting ATPase ATPase C chain